MSKFAFHIILSNVLIACSILLLLLHGFEAGFFLVFVHYVNHILPEPLRFVSMFIFPFHLIYSIFFWRWLLPFGIRFYERDFVKWRRSSK